MNKTRPQKAKKILEMWQEENGINFTKREQLKKIAKKFNKSTQTIRRIIENPEKYGIEVDGKVSKFKQKRIDLNNKALKKTLALIIVFIIIILISIWTTIL